MSSVQERKLVFSYSNANNYLAASGGVDVAYNVLGLTGIAYIPVLVENTGYAALKANANDKLYPNNSAHPISGYFNYTSESTNKSSANIIQLQFAGEAVTEARGSSSQNVITVDETSTASAIVNSTKSTPIRFYIAKSGSFYSNGFKGETSATIALYFTRYDFAAVGMTGVTASVSSATGYDGDSITWTADAQSGYTFEGWYADAAMTQLVSTSQSYTETVSGADKTLYAKVTAPATRTLTVSYSGRGILTDTISGDVTVTYDGAQLFSLGYGTKTLLCAGKVMRGAVTVGGKTLNCAGKLMQSDVTVSVS